MLEKFFTRIKAAPLSEKVASRDGCIYMYWVMKGFGWFPPKEGLKRRIWQSWTFISFAFGAVYLPLAFALSYIMDFKSFTPDEFLTSLQVAINAYGGSVKSTIVYHNLWRLRKTEDILDELDKRARSDEERQKVHETAAFTNYVFLIFTIIYNVYTTSTFLSYLLSGRPPYSLYNPFIDWHANRISLVTEATFEYIVMTIAVTQDLLADTYLLIYILLIRGHFDLLRRRVVKLRTNPDWTEEENYDELVNCIKDHKMIIECCHTIHPIISGTIFVQFGLIGLVLGFTLINIFFFSNIWRGLSSSVFALAVLMETFPFSYNCNLIMDECEELANGLFHSKWIDAERRYKRTLTFFMHQAQEHIVFIAGGIIPITMNSNVTVAKFAFSIITIVREMNLAEQFK